jgi:hypothetical protein
MVQARTLAIMELFTLCDCREGPCLLSHHPCSNRSGSSSTPRSVKIHLSFDPTHPLGCHRRRIPSRTVFEHIIDALVHGSGYERIATTGCSDRTIRRRLKTWAKAGIAQRIHAIALAAYDLIIGLELEDLCVDGCITNAPWAGDKAGPSPLDRRKGGLKRSVATEAAGIPLGICPPPRTGTIPRCWNRLWKQPRPKSGHCPKTSPATWTPVTTVGFFVPR